PGISLPGLRRAASARPSSGEAESPRGRTGYAAWRRGPAGGADGTAPRGVVRLRQGPVATRGTIVGAPTGGATMGPTPGRALTPREFVEGCWAFKQGHAPRGRFMQRLIAGECSPTELRRWAKDAYYYTASATPNIAAWLALAPIVPDRSIFRAIARNLAGELGYIREAAHVDLYEQFLDGLGISVVEVQASL